MSAAARYTPQQAERLAALLRARFFTRTDVAAALMPWSKPHQVDGGDLLDALLRAHVQGQAAPKAVARYVNRRNATKALSGWFRLGSYTPDAQGHTRWLCVDFDGADHADGLVDPQAALLQAHQACEALGVPAHLERSGGGKGWHLWVLFAEPVPAKDARRLALALAPADQPLASGRLADARVNRGIEVFPKQERARKGGFGNLVWLPFWGEAPEGANELYRLDAEGHLVAYLPDDLQTMTGEALAAALEALPEPAPDDSGPARATSSDDAVQAFLSRVDRLDADTPDEAAPSTDWSTWRAAALAALPLDAVYGPWLTGAYNSEHWLECRDPASTTGDRDPSAGVADGEGDAQRGTFHSFRDHRKLSVFDFMVEQGLAGSFTDAVRRVAELSSVPLPARRAAPRPATKPARASRRGYPVVVTNARQLRDIIADARHVLNHVNGMDPFLFNRAGRPTRLVRVGGTPHLEFLDETAMYGVLARVADWVRRTDEGDVDVMPPHDVARDLVANTDAALPLLDAVVAAPVFDRQGDLAAQPGYHRDAGLWYHEPAGFAVPPVPDAPTPADVARARALLLDDLLVDFPFVSASDRAHAVAGILLPFVRRMIDGPTPIHLFEAPTPGAGKSLLGDAITVIATGRQAEPTTIGRDDEETRKKITSVLSLGKPVILIDNVRTGIDSASLAAALTSDTWQDRILGQSKMILLPNRAVWLVTANNPDLSLEIARRSVRIRIEPPDDRPWKRQTFKHAPLISWVKQRRRDLVHAVLVLIRAWMAGGRPPAPRTLGSFEAWAEVIGGILQAAGIPGFLENAEELYEAADREGQEWREFIAAWWDEHGDLPVAAGDLLALAKDRGMLLSVLGDKSDRSQAIRIGKALHANRNRRFGSFRVELGGISHKQKLWMLSKHEAEAAPQAGQTSLGLEALDLQQEGGCGDVPDPHPPQHPPLEAPEIVAQGGCGGSGGCVSTPARVIAHTHAHMRRARAQKGPDHIPHIPHIPQAEQNRGLPEGDVRSPTSPTSPTSPGTPLDAPVDLADFHEEDA